MTAAILMADFVEKLPSPELLSRYEKLGIVGVLLLILAAIVVLGTGLAGFVGFWLIRFGRLHITEQEKQTTQQMAQTLVLQDLARATGDFRDVLATNARDLKDSQRDLHERLDNLFQCGEPECPVRAARVIREKKPVIFDRKIPRDTPVTVAIATPPDPPPPVAAVVASAEMAPPAPVAGGHVVGSG